ncbi:MAG: nucleoside triphosphate pyrophosphohydrolase [Oligoflexales bacterium]|nr:nucleoside triphosphate pyrophosphohydrolase [Oligoflexales bacterium]
MSLPVTSRFDNAKELFAQFCELVATLRDPIKGCPWDLSQTHQSLMKFLVEEAYEVSAAVQEDDPAKICDELGDILLQVVLNAQLGADAKTFTIDQVIQAIHDKMTRRHPHVFGTEEEKQERELSQIYKRWYEIKKAENPKAEASFMQQQKVHKIFPATSQAAKIGSVAQRVGFDWDETDAVLQQFFSEVKELQEEWQLSATRENKARLQEEIGDVYFSLAQVCRHLDLDPEMTASQGNQKFLKRFAAMEDLVAKQGKHISNLRKDEWEELWSEVKK